jgi:two-component system, LytTR family, response regulator
MITCFVLDDEQHAINVLTHFISQTPFLQLVGTANNPLQALQFINEQEPDLLFSDIHMPDISGLELVKSLKGKTKAILCSAYSEFAVEGFELEVIDYLVKPVRLPRFLQAVQRAAHFIEGPAMQQPLALEDDYIFVKTEQKGKLLKINLADIEYIEGKKNYVAIHYNGQITMSLLNMKDLEDRLPALHFIRVQRSFIVPLRKISGIERNMVLLKEYNIEIVLGENYKIAFLERMKDKLM